MERFYSKFHQRMLQRSTAGECFRRYHGPMPFNRFHKRGIERGSWCHEMLMSKWVKRPWKAFDLYWKLHPQEYSGCGKVVLLGVLR